MGIGKKMTKGMIGGGVNIAHKSKMSNAAKNQMSFPGGMPGPGNYGSMDNKIVGKGMMKYLAGESVGMKKYGQHKGPEKALVGKQENLPEALKDKIEAAPGMYGKKKKGMKQMGEMEEAPMSGGPAKGGNKKKEKKDSGSISVDADKILPTKDITVKVPKTPDLKSKSKKPSDSKPKPSAPKGALGSDKRKAEYDAKGWKYDDTIKGYNRDGSKKEVKSVKPEKKKKTAGPKTIKAKEVLKTAKSDAKEGQAGRQDTRKAKRISKRAKRVSKREDIRSGRAKAKADGLKGKAKRDAIKASKKAAKENQNK
jgi:hypothetical protein